MCESCSVSPAYRQRVVLFVRASRAIELNFQMRTKLSSEQLAI